MSNFSFSRSPSHRKERVSETLRAALVPAIREVLCWDNLLTSESVTIMNVRLSRDLSSAVIEVSILYTNIKSDEAARHLSRLAPLIRKKLAPRLALKKLPDLKFVACSDGALEITLQQIRAQENIQGEQ